MRLLKSQDLKIDDPIQQSTCLELVTSRYKFPINPNEGEDDGISQEFSSDCEDESLCFENFMEAIFDDALDTQEFPIPLLEAVILPNGEIIYEQLDNLSLL